MCHDAREDRWGVVGDQEEVDGLGQVVRNRFARKASINQKFTLFFAL